MGMLENGKISHISQMMSAKAVNWYHGEKNYYDILGSTIESAMEAAKQALYNLENPLVPHSSRKIEVQQQILKEKNFYRTFIKKLEGV